MSKVCVSYPNAQKCKIGKFVYWTVVSKECVTVIAWFNE